MTALITNHEHDKLITRRIIIFGAAASLLCAPAIVRATSLMPVKRVVFPIVPVAPSAPIYMGFLDRLRIDWMEKCLMSGWDDDRHAQTFGGISEAQARRSVIRARANGWVFDKNSKGLVTREEAIELLKKTES